MNKFMTISRIIVPEALELLERRFNILRVLGTEKPVGRRFLARQTGLTERIARTETEFLSRQGFIEIQPGGMVITEQGQEILSQLGEVMEDILGLEELSEFLAGKMGFRRVLVVPGNSDEDPVVLEELGRAAARALQKVLHEDSVIALTGGNTIKQMVEQFPRDPHPRIRVVPARGAVGQGYEVQSNTLVSRLADRLGGSSRQLNVPDNLSSGAMDALLQEPDVQETVELICQADIVVAGVGDAMVMARRRNLPESDLRKLRENNAMGEFFGGYYDSSGRLIKQHRTVGLSIETAENAREVFILAGGRAKARAIHSVKFRGLPVTLVTDEGAARALADLLRSEPSFGQEGLNTEGKPS